MRSRFSQKREKKGTLLKPIFFDTLWRKKCKDLCRRIYTKILPLKCRLFNTVKPIFVNLTMVFPCFWHKIAPIKIGPTS